jgi:hypothetical protein
MNSWSSPHTLRAPWRSVGSGDLLNWACPAGPRLADKAAVSRIGGWAALSEAFSLSGQKSDVAVAIHYR